MILVLFSLQCFAVVDPTLTLTKNPDEVILRINLDYKSKFKKAVIQELLRPENNHLPELFKDRIVVQGGPDKYAVDFSINILLGVRQDYKCELTYVEKEKALQSEHTYSFLNFDKLFKSSIIKVLVTENKKNTSVSIVQIATMKASEFKTISAVPRGEVIFQNKIADNIKNFQKSTGGL